ncbi:MAG: peptide/nickel transport system substrate-binding protein [Frankiales bacterium]|jgi:peptide/nickel transport system substrate-binding protein|nr:peptide/nickel transport system substrate-binding protein [Frankiales bacterium]MDX6242696.1 peptide/nickel transport system substrate-binding protein [Frankiales bacterium]
MRTSLARRRPLVVLAVPLSLALVLTACGGSSTKNASSTSAAGASSGAAPTSTTLHLSFLQDPGQPPDPDIYYAGQGLLLTQNLYEGLLSYKLGSAKAELAPGLATAWKVSNNFKTYDLTLRTGVTFHDGTPFDSSAVKASFDRRLAVNQGPAYMVSDVASITTPSKTEVVITLKDSNTAFLDYLACAYSPKMMSPTALAANKGSDNDEKYLTTHDIGTGPYTLTQANVGQNYQMKAYPGWWGPKVFYQTVEIPVVSDLSTQEEQFNKGDLAAILHDLNAPAVKDYLGKSSIKTYSLPSFLTEQVYVNPTHGMMKTLAGRQAFQASLDIKSLQQAVFAGRGDLATGIYPEGLVPGDTQNVVADPSKITAFAKSAAAADKTITLGYDTSQPDDQQLANLVSAKLQAYGITAKVQGYPTADVFGWIGGSLAKAPDVLFTSFWPDAANPYTEAHIEFAPDGGLNYLHCSDPQITAELPGVLQTGDMATYAKIGAQAVATGCWTNIVWRKDFMVAQPWLKGVEAAHDIGAPFSLHIAALSG